MKEFIEELKKHDRFTLVFFVLLHLSLSVVWVWGCILVYGFSLLCNILGTLQFLIPVVGWIVFVVFSTKQFIRKKYVFAFSLTVFGALLCVSVYFPIAYVLVEYFPNTCISNFI